MTTDYTLPTPDDIEAALQRLRDAHIVPVWPPHVTDQTLDAIRQRQEAQAVPAELFDSGAKRGVEAGKPDFTLIEWDFVYAIREYDGVPLAWDTTHWFELVIDLLREWALYHEADSLMYAALLLLEAENTDTREPLLYTYWTPSTLTRYAAWMTMGAARYGRMNWKKGIPLSRYYRAFFRHFMAYLAGETIEQNSEGEWVAVDHFAACIFNLCGLWYVQNGIESGAYPAGLDDLGDE
jgi:hypothetical protein